MLVASRLAVPVIMAQTFAESRRFSNHVRPIADRGCASESEVDRSTAVKGAHIHSVQASTVRLFGVRGWVRGGWRCQGERREDGGGDGEDADSEGQCGPGEVIIKSDRGDQSDSDFQKREDRDLEYEERDDVAAGGPEGAPSTEVLASRDRDPRGTADPRRLRQ